MDEQNKSFELNVTSEVALAITCLEFDAKIAEAEAVISDLKRQKAKYIYDFNLQLLIKNKISS